MSAHEKKAEENECRDWTQDWSVTVEIKSGITTQELLLSLIKYAPFKE